MNTAAAPDSSTPTADSEEPPSLRARQLNIFELHANEFFPKHYLAIEGHRLYPFTIDTKPLFDKYLTRTGITLSDYSFANNIIWLSQKSGFYQIVDDCFCLFSLNGHCLSMLLPPLGRPEDQRHALATCFAIMDGYNGNPYYSLVEFVYRDFTDSATAEDTGAHWLIERALPDYIYRTEDLIELRGNAYKTKRNEVNQFRRAYPNHHLEPLGPQHRPGIRQLLDRWLRNRMQYLSGEAIADFFYTVEQERQAIDRAFEYYDRLGLMGLALIIDDQLAGFTFGEQLTADVANVLVEKTDFAIPGSAQYLFREFAKVFAHCTFINVGDDLGLENLRRVKMSYRPALFGEKVTLRHPLEASRA
jgi:uncharacterized protein